MHGVSEKEGTIYHTSEVEGGTRWGKAHSKQRKVSEAEFKKIQGHGTNIAKWLTDGKMRPRMGRLGRDCEGP